MNLNNVVLEIINEAEKKGKEIADKAKIEREKIIDEALKNAEEKKKLRHLQKKLVNLKADRKVWGRVLLRHRDGVWKLPTKPIAKRETEKNPRTS